MLTDLFDYHLPKKLIAQNPAEKRDEARLMALHRATGKIEHRTFKDLPQLLKPGDLLVLNDSRVIPVRLYAKKAGGGRRVEITLIEKTDKSENRWRCLMKHAKRLKAGTMLEIKDEFRLKVLDRLPDGSTLVELEAATGVMAALERAGRAPLPPYIHRTETDPREPDLERYQTVYARCPGAIAAPTAGLHFTDELLDEIKKRGIRTAPVTLHVGWGSFAPVREKNAENHKVAPEYFSINDDTAEAIRETRRLGGRVVAVGTTTARAMESAWKDGQVCAGSGWTELFIVPGHAFHSFDVLLTNFHLPRSSLIMLVAAFAGMEFILDAYREAVDMKYRFYSYGDAMLIW